MDDRIERQLVTSRISKILPQYKQTKKLQNWHKSHREIKSYVPSLGKANIAMATATNSKIARRFIMI